MFDLQTPRHTSTLPTPAVRRRAIEWRLRARSVDACASLVDAAKATLVAPTRSMKVPWKPCGLVLGGG
jgi:hypothetical protein